MSANLDDRQLRAYLERVNAQDTTQIQSLLDHFSRDAGSLVPLINEFREQLGFGGASTPVGDDTEPGAPDFYQKGGQVFIQVLREHPIFHEQRSLVAGIPILGEDGDEIETQLARNVSELLVAGVLAIGLLEEPDERYFGALTHIAFNADAISTLLRTVLGGKALPDLDEVIRLPDKLENLYLHSCVVGVQNALSALGQALSVGKATSQADRITGLQPKSGCAGDTITIQGQGFGNQQPSGVEVWFPTLDGKCAKAQIIPPWSDTAIQALAPANVGTGWVGFVEFPANATSLAGPATALAGEMEQCFGKAAFAAAQKIKAIGMKASPVPCPPPLSNGANYFLGGPPVVDWFTINGGVSGPTDKPEDDLIVEAGTDLILSWQVQNATLIDVRRTSGNGPPFTMTGANQQQINIGKFSSVYSLRARYELTATNACGTVTHIIRLGLRKTPALKIVGVEVIQAIQRFNLSAPALNNTVPFVARKRTMVRVYIDSGITDGFKNAIGKDEHGQTLYGENIQPDVTGRVIIWPSGAKQGFDAEMVNGSGIYVNAKPRSEIQRDALSDTLNFELPVDELKGVVTIEVAVWVKGHQNEIGTGWVAHDNSTVVTFEPRRTQTLVRIRVSDDTSGPTPLPAPTAAAFAFTMTGATRRFPIAEDGIVIALKPPFTAIKTSSANVNLAFRSDWDHFLDHIDWIAGQFPNQGEIWAALVPMTTRYPMMGIANAGLKTGHRKFVAMSAVGLPVSGVEFAFAHEMAHTFAPPSTGGARMGIKHADCGSPPDPDPRLPAKIEDFGMDVPQRKLIPPGSSEVMSVPPCFDPFLWTSIALWQMLFDELV